MHTSARYYASPGNAPSAADGLIMPGWMEDGHAAVDGAGTPEWVAGGHGCENTAAGEEGINPRMSLYCQAGPTQECDEHGDLLVVHAGKGEGEGEGRASN